MSYAAQIAKAIVAALVAGLTAVVTGLDDNALTAREWVTALTAFLVALGATWAIPNAAAEDPPQ